MKIVFFIFCLIASHTAFSQVDLQKGLRLYYPFSGEIKDSSGHNNNPVRNIKTQLTEDRFGRPNSACHFNGKNSYLQIPDSPDLHMDDHISISVWVRPTGFYKGKCHANSIMMKGNQNGASGFFMRYDDNIYRHDGNCYAKLDTIHQDFYGHGTNYPSFEPFVQSYKWQSVIYIYDGTYAKIYINGKEVKSEESPVTFYFSNKADLFIGTEGMADYPYWLNADLDDVRIYDRALNIEEISALAGLTNPSQQGGQ